MKVQSTRFSRCCKELVRSGLVAKRRVYIRLGKIGGKGIARGRCIERWDIVCHSHRQDCD